MQFRAVGAANHGLARDDGELAEHEWAGLLVRATAEVGLNAGEELGGNERFCDVVIGPRLQAPHHVLGLVSRGDNDNREITQRSQPDAGVEAGKIVG